MNVFVPSSAAEPLSDALWALVRPEQVRDPKDTTHLFPWKDALDGSRWLMVNPTLQINVHALAELGAIAGILQPWIDGGQLQADTNELLAAYVLAHRGQRITPWEVFPQFFRDLSKTHAEMIAAGLVAEPPTP